MATVLAVAAAGLIVRLQGLGAQSAALFILLSLFYALSVIMLTVRDVAADHIGRLDQRISTLESALRDLNRRAGAPEAADTGQDAPSRPENRTEL